MIAGARPPALAPECLAAHRRLSACGAAFLERTREEPEYLDPESFARLERADGFVRYPVQPWPFWVDRATADEMERVTLGISRLVRSLPERLFAGRPELLGRFYGLDPEYLAVIVEMLRDAEHMASLAGRGDFLLDDTGFHCLEMNLASNLGGWQIAAIAPLVLESRAVRRFLEDQGLRAGFRDPVACFFAHAVDRLAASEELPDSVHLAFAVRPEERFGPRVEAYAAERFRAVLRDRLPEVAGELSFCSYGQLRERDGRLFLERTPVHVVVELYGGAIVQPVFRALVAGTIHLYNGPVAAVLGDKRNLALLSELEDSPRLTEEERELVRTAVPWTRELRRRETTYRGRKVDLLDAALGERERLVLKPAAGARGEGVHIGSRTPREEWAARIRKAEADTAPWVVQEAVGSLPFVGLKGAGEIERHDVVWGLFSFGDRYGGGFARTLSAELGGAVNASRGASQAAILEVEA